MAIYFEMPKTGLDYWNILSACVNIVGVYALVYCSRMIKSKWMLVMATGMIIVAVIRVFGACSNINPLCILVCTSIGAWCVTIGAVGLYFDIKRFILNGNGKKVHSCT